MEYLAKVLFEYLWTTSCPSGDLQSTGLRFCKLLAASRMQWSCHGCGAENPCGLEVPGRAGSSPRVLKKYFGQVLKKYSGLFGRLESSQKVIEKYSASTFWGRTREARRPKMHRPTTFRRLFDYFSVRPKIPEYFLSTWLDYLLSTF